jgi:ribulose-5-phosphate 4-epimerase/fuculose-1-phosphate aldolase
VTGFGRARRDLVRAGARLREAALSPGTTGNLSVRTGSQIVVTRTGADLGSLRRADFAILNLVGSRVSGPSPTKEWPLHVALYESPLVGAVVHTHQLHATALSCLSEIEGATPGLADLPILTPYLTMRAGPLEVAEYARPGTGSLTAVHHDRPRVILLRNHGAIVGARTMTDAVALAAELEEVARLHFLTRDALPQALTAAQVAELHASGRVG